jgi:hypothetical protein
MYKVVTAKLTGIPGPMGWSQAYEFNSPNTKTGRGGVFLVVSTSQAHEEVGDISVSRQIISKFQNDYFEMEVGTAYDALKNSVEDMSTEFNRIWRDVEIIALAVIDHEANAFASGGGQVLIVREENLARILENNTSIPVGATGTIKPGDRLILATKTFFAQGNTYSSLKDNVVTKSIENLADHYLASIHSLPNQSLVALILLEIKSKPALHTYSPLPVPEFKEQMNKSPLLKISSFFKKFSRMTLSQNIYIKPNLTEEVSPKSKKLTFLIALVLLIFLSISIGFGVRQKKINDVKSKYTAILTQASNEVDQAISLASISPERSRQLFMDSQEKIAQIDSMNVKDSNLLDLKKKISDSRAFILGEYLVSPEMYLDLSLLTSGFKGDAIALSGGQVYVLDAAGRRVVSVNVSTKKSKVVAGPTIISSARALACYEEKAFVLQDDGIYEVGSGSTKVVAKTWPGDALISVFGGNLYVMDIAGNQIYRYPGSGNSFGERQNWLASGASVNLAGARQMTIDGSIYVLFPNSKIAKFSQGSPLNFNLSGVVPEVGSVDAINASPDNENIYLLDRLGKRVVVTDKKGVYKAQYIDAQIENATNLAASEADKKIILLGGDKLYSLELTNQ